MINPEPVHRSSSPYRASTNDRLPLRGAAPAQSSPEQPRLPGTLQPRTKWTRRRKVGTTALVLLIALFGFAYWRYASLRGQIVVANDTQKTALLGYDPEKGLEQLNPADFKQLGDGRINILLLGMDATGGSAGLTDSIQVISFDPINKKASLTSIPRDLDVPSAAYKINGVYKSAESSVEGSGGKAAKTFASEILGTNISYFVLTNFTGLKDLVDAVGGIQIDVPKGFSDPTFPAEKGFGYEPFSISKGLQTMNGKTALRYARSRHADSDFGRSSRQQLVIEAIRKKALSAGVLANPVKLNSILTALGKNVKTDLPTDSMRKVFEIYNSIPDDQRQNLVLDTSAQLALLTQCDGCTGKGYTIYPKDGVGEYDSIHRWHRSLNPDPLVNLEQPTIVVANGGGATTKQLEKVVATLNDFGYKASLSTSTPAKSLQKNQTALYSRNNAKPFSRNYLSTYFSLTPSTDNPLGSESDFELLYSPAK